MYELINQEQPKKVVRMVDLNCDERERLVGAFAWLIKEHKKQNPEFYKIKQTENL